MSDPAIRRYKKVGERERTRRKGEDTGSGINLDATPTASQRLVLFLREEGFSMRNMYLVVAYRKARIFLSSRSVSSSKLNHVRVCDKSLLLLTALSFPALLVNARSINKCFTSHHRRNCRRILRRNQAWRFRDV